MRTSSCLVVRVTALGRTLLIDACLRDMSVLTTPDPPFGAIATSGAREIWSAALRALLSVTTRLYYANAPLRSEPKATKRKTWLARRPFI